MKPGASAVVTPSLWRLLEPSERATVIRVLGEQLPRDQAVTALAALAGAPEEVAALPHALHDRVEKVLLDAFPDGVNSVIVSTLGINNVPSAAWIPQVRARFAGKTVEEAVAIYRELQME